VPKKCGLEPYKKRTAQGMILGKGGIKMSKSKGNVINPDKYIEKYGADTVRIYEMFMGPFDQAIAWDDKGVVGVHRFLDKVWNYLNIDITGAFADDDDQQQWIAGKHGETSNNIKRLLHKTIKKVTEDIEEMKFNTAISALMIFVNSFYREFFYDESPGAKIIEKLDFEKFLLLLSPFAPHLAEELWQLLGYKKSIIYQKWPEYDKSLIQADEIELVIQINGKVREKIKVAAGILEEEASQLAIKSQKIQKWLAGKEPKKIIFIKGRLINIVV
jgi:leucyl-tRNA synthetase